MPPKEDWHGWSVGDASLYVGPLPGRKSICLYELDRTGGGSTIRTLAFFRNEQGARKVLAALDLMNAGHYIMGSLGQSFSNVIKQESDERSY